MPRCTLIGASSWRSVRGVFLASWRRGVLQRFKGRIPSRAPDPRAASGTRRARGGPASPSTPPTMTPPSRRSRSSSTARAAARRARSAVGLTGMLELITGILLAAGAVYFVLRPLLHPELPEPGKGDEGGLEEGEDPEDDLSPRAVALRALKEIEFDRATGKLYDADYD